MDKISTGTKSVLGSAVICLMGAVAVDCGLYTTGITMMCIGAIGIILGPSAANL